MTTDTWPGWNNGFEPLQGCLTFRLRATRFYGDSNKRCGMVLHHRTRKILATFMLTATLCLGSSDLAAQATMSNFCGLFVEGSKSRSDLMAIQRGLKTRNLYKGSIDGIFGKGSCNALTKWAQCEDATRRVIKKSSLRRLVLATPSARDLDCYISNSNPIILSVSSTDKKVLTERLTTIRVKFNDRRGNLVVFKLDGFLTRPSRMTQYKTLSRSNEFCLHPNDNKFGVCVKVKTPKTTIKNRFARFSEAERESVTDACVLIASEYVSISSLLNNIKSKELLKDERLNFQKFAYKCLDAIQELFPNSRYAFAASKIKKIPSNFYCTQSKLHESINKKTLEALSLYSPVPKGILKNYKNAIAQGESLLGKWMDEKKSCLGVSERKVLEAVVSAQNLGSLCQDLPTTKDIRSTFISLKAKGLIETNSVEHKKISGLIWSIETAAFLEDKLSSLDFYSEASASSRDCRLDTYELEALSASLTSLSQLTNAENHNEKGSAFSTNTQKPTCKVDPKLCSVVQLCDRASNVSNGVRIWSEDPLLNDYVEVARENGLGCGVKLVGVKSPDGPNCAEEASKCSLADLCATGTRFDGDGRLYWSTDPAVFEHVNLAKQQGVSCGVTVSEVISTLEDSCSRNPSSCSLSELCRKAISFETGSLNWSADVSLTPHVEFAQNAGITCGISKQVEVSDIDALQGLPEQATKKITLGRHTNRKALVIGNSQYSDQTPLKNPSSDASKIARSLETVGFEVELALDLSRRELGRSITKFSSRAKSADISLFYFAGHGIEINGRNFLVPIDAIMDDPAALKYDVIDLQEAIDAAAGSSKLSLVLVDACRDNPFSTQTAGLNRSLNRGLKVIETDDVSKNQIVSFAAESGRVAEDGNDLNSPYAKAFSELVVQPNLEVGKLFRQLSDSVSVLTNGRQVPVTRTRLSSEDMFFVIER